MVSNLFNTALHGNPDANHVECGKNIFFYQKNIFGCFNANNLWNRVQNISRIFLHNYKRLKIQEDA